MPPEPNKINRIEDLKRKLSSRSFQGRPEHRGGYSHPMESEIPDSWPKSASAAKSAEVFFNKTSKFKKFFIFSLVFFGLALVYAGYNFFAGGNIVSNNNIDLTIVGNNFTSGGEALPLVVSITNRNNTALELVDLVAEYPKGSTDDSSSNTEHLRESLGTIPAGATRNENEKIVLYGEQGSTRVIKISIEYRVAGSSAIFVKEKDYPVTISSTPISLSMDAPDNAIPNQDITFHIKETLNATTPVPNIIMKISYPTGFQFENAVPAPSYGNSVWNLGDLAPGAEHDIAVTGKLIGVFDGEQKTFNVSTGSQSSADKAAIDVVFNSLSHLLTVQKPFVDAELFINGNNNSQYAVDSNSAVNGEVKYTNNQSTVVNDVEIKLKFSGNALNPKTVVAAQGFYDSAQNTITWSKSTYGQLAQLNPGDSGTLDFSFSPISLYQSGSGILSNPTVNIEVDLSGKQSDQNLAATDVNNSTSAAVKIISDLNFSTKAQYQSGPFANSGPLPPKVGTATTYTIAWSISNTSNNISNAQVAATLPDWITYTGQVSPAVENLSYNSATRQVLWNLGRVNKGTGITSAARTVYFQVSIKPSLSQVGSEPALVNGTVLTGHDDFANVDVKMTKDSLNTVLQTDPKDSGIVQAQ